MELNSSSDPPTISLNEYSQFTFVVFIFKGEASSFEATA